MTMHNFDLKKIFVVNYVILICFVFYVFYSFPLRQEIEERLTNVKLKLAPYFNEVDDVVVVAIDGPSISAIEAAGSTDISYRGLTRVVDAVLKQDPKLVIPLLHTQVFNPLSQERKEFLQHYSQHVNVIVGLFDTQELGGYVANEQSPPLGTAGVGYAFRTQQVRTLPFLSLKESLPTLLYQAATVVQPQNLPELVESLPRDSDGKIVFPVHYFPTRKIPTVSARDALQLKTNEFKDKVVVIGYTEYRPYAGRITEPTFVNTPLSNNPDNTRFGTPLAYVHAIAMNNLLHNAWMRSSPIWLTVLLTALSMMVVFVLWRFGTVIAVLGFVVFAFGSLAVGAFVIGFLHLNLPYADLIAFSFLATLTGALRRLEYDARQRLQEESEQKTRKDLMNLQSYFLDKFAYALSDVNQSILGTLTKHEVALSGLNQDVYGKMKFSSLELEDYLTSIKKVSQISSPRAIKVNFRPCVVSEVIKRTEARHANKASERKQRIELDLTQDCTVRTDEVLLMQILDNLLSNAIKYSPAGSTIQINTILDRKCATIRITDQGPGLKPGEEKRIFEKFYRIKDDQVFQIKGHGLGLYLSRYFATLINGVVDVEPQTKAGATFFVRIPKK